MRKNDEYQLCKTLSIYMRLQHPGVLFHWDLAGLNLSMAQAGMQKAIQFGRGFPDFQILEPRGIYSGCFIEIKADNTKLYKKNGTYATPHIAEQADMIKLLIERGYRACFGVGFDECKDIIDRYLER